MTPEASFVISVGTILAATAAGYAARKLRFVGERAAEILMLGVMIFGYTPIAFLSLWQLKLNLADAWVPVLACVHMVIMVVLGLGIGRLLTRDRGDIGIFGLSASVGNTGCTMGGFIVFLLYGENGLGLVGLLGISWVLALVFLMYPLARYYGEGNKKEPLLRLFIRSIFDWRSVTLPAAIIAVVLSLAGVQRPQAFSDFHIVDILVFGSIVTAYFAVGLRLSLAKLWSGKKFIFALAAARFVLALGVGIALAALTYLTAWPLKGYTLNVHIIESFVPTAVTVVAVANMFRLRPHEASVLFVTNALIYLLLVLPLVLWYYS